MTCFYACSLVALFAGVVGASCVQAEEAVSPCAGAYARGIQFGRRSSL